MPLDDASQPVGTIYKSPRLPHEIVLQSLVVDDPGIPMVNTLSCPTDVNAASSNIFRDYQESSEEPIAFFQPIPLPRHELVPPTTAILPFLPLPSYIKPLPCRLGFDDVTYLLNKGALIIPGDRLRNELLRNYVEYMHPFMPLVDWPKLMRIIKQADGVQSISLLLFQALMFTGLATIDMHFLKSAGFSTRREARRVFFNKARLLYDLDYENDSVTSIQALLLMTYWKESPTGRKETHHWIEIAVLLSHKIGLHRDPDESALMEQWPRKLRKRIWWSVYMRDSQIALGTRKSTLMKDVDFNVPMLQLSDFELTTPSDDICFDSANYPKIPSLEQQQQLAIMCIEMAKLCICVRQILSIQHGVTGSKGGIRTATTITAGSPESGEQSLQNSAEALQLWKDELPVIAHDVTPIRHDLLQSSGSVVLNRSFLHLLYNAALSFLHRSQLLPSTAPLTLVFPSQAVEISHNKVRHAANKITIIASSLQDLDLIRYLPSTAITILLPAIVMHLQDVLAPRSFLQLKSLQNFSKCMQIMAALRDMYAAADYSTAFLQAAIGGTEIGPVDPPTCENTEHSDVNTNSQYATGIEILEHSTLSGPQNRETDQISNYPPNPIFHRLDTVSDVPSTAMSTVDGTTMVDKFGLDNDVIRAMGGEQRMYDIGQEGFGGMEDGNSVGGATLNMDWLMNMGTEDLILGNEAVRPALF